MEFRIADTFTDSLARLSGDEQKAVKTTAFDESPKMRTLKRFITPSASFSMWPAHGLAIIYW